MITRLIRHYIISDELPLEGRLFNIITCIGLFGAFVAATMTVVFAGVTVGSMLIVVLAVGLLMLILAANKTGNYQMASMLICLGVCCCLYPLIFFTTGGILSGMPCWFILGIVIIFAMLRGAKMVIALTLTIITQIICAIIEYYYPEIVVRYQPYSFPQFEDVVQAYLIVGMVVGLTIKLQLIVYEKEKKKADAASEAKAEFLANMSHEIRTPLNAILGMNEMIVRESESKEIQEYALNVENAGKTLLSLINDVLDMSRIEAGCMDLVAVEYRLNTLIQDSLNLIKERMQEKNLILKLQINPNIPDILYGDEVRIRQILTNLLSNAVKYTECGSVTLIMDYRKLTKPVLQPVDIPGADQTQIELFVAVEDTGCGIREEDISHLFDSFNRVNERNNRNIEGTGLGLSITKRLVEQMQGTIEVESTYGSGSRFQVYFPQIVIEATPLGNMQENSHQNSQQNKQKNEIGKGENEAFFLAPDAHILIVDDNAVNRMVIKKLLERTEMKIDTAESGAECLRFIQQEGRQYDLILLDHMMPQMDGIETLHRIRDIRHASNQRSPQIRPALTIPVIALTANAISGARQKYLEAGFSDYITKPISGQDLERILMHYLPAEKISYINQSLQNASMPVNQPERETGLRAQNGNQSNRDLRKHQQEALQQILNYEVARQYSAGTVEDVLENVEIVLEQEQLMIETLHQCYTATEWADYAIQAHALKTTLNTIGLEQMADRARQLELAAKEPTEQNITLIIDLHMNFVADFQNTMTRLREVIDAKLD